MECNRKNLYGGGHMEYLDVEGRSILKHVVRSSSKVS